MSKDAKCISFVNPKGGNKVLVVYLDPRANATLSSGIYPGAVNTSMYDAVLSCCGYDSTQITSVILERKVVDTGIEIKHDNLGRLFHKFEQLVELHGGKIWAESKYREGSVFTFTLPLRSCTDGVKP